MKEEIPDSCCRRRCACRAAIWIVLGLALTAVTCWIAIQILQETRSYLESQRTPVMLPGGAAKF